MKIEFRKVVRDYLALMGESPGLSPILEEGEDSVVLTLEEELRVRLPALAVEATLITPAEINDEIRLLRPNVLWSDAGMAEISLPPEFLRFHSLRMMGWRAPVRELEPADTLRDQLRGNAPPWMACKENPLVVLVRDSEGLKLQVFGCDQLSERAELMYIPLPELTDDYLVIGRGAYGKVLELLTGR